MRDLFIFLLLAFLTACSSQKASELQLAPVEFSIAKPSQWQMGNGVTVLFLENNELPLVEAELYLPVGTLHVDSPGLLDALISQMRSGGIRSLTPQQLDRKLDALAASIEGSVGAEFSSFSLASHKEDFSEILALFHLMLTEPAFNLARLNLWKAQNLDAIRRRREDPQTMAALTFAKAFYAGPAVYTDSLMPGDLHKLDRALLLKAYGRLITPRGAILCVTGRIQEPELRDLLEKRLGTWGISSGSKPTAHKRMDAGVSLLNSAVSTDSDLIKTIPKPIFREVPGVYLVRAPFEQAAVVMGLPGPARDFPGYHSLSVFNRYFSSGGFSSVLFNEIRTKRGLAYSVGGGFAPGNGTGVFQIGLGTRVNQVSAAITEILTLVTVARKETASTDLLREIKESIERGFVFNFATQAATLDREAARRLLGFPEDFDESFLAKVRAVTEENLLRVAVDYLDPSRFVIVVVGDIGKEELVKAFPGVEVHEVQFQDEPFIPNRTK